MSHSIVFKNPILWSLILLLFVACSQDDDGEIPQDPTMDSEFSFGWFGEEDLDQVPVSTNFGFGNGTLPSEVNLVPLFPPMGDQGQYGTCVAWSVGYNIKTAVQGHKNGWSASELANPSKQASPKDLFTAIPDNEKGQNCNGTNFSYALNVLQNRGVASLQTVPYTSLGNCSQSSSQASWASEAANNKIKYWRKIDPSIQSIKQNLANNIPVILGARLPNNFMDWQTSDVFTAGTTNSTGQHAYHALVIAGYDDNKGPNGAFRIINSWGNFWGDNGYIWIDYNYLINEFCDGGNGTKPLFIVADGDQNDNNPPDPVDPVQESGADLAPWVFSDLSNYPYYSSDATSRTIEFNVYNIGNDAARSQQNWSLYYIYYNAYNANDYGIIFYDEFNTSIAQNTFNCPTADHCILNIDIPGGGSFGFNAFGQDYVQRSYFMPQISGSYYLALIADAGDVFNENDELNNIFYTTQEPKYFEFGYSLKSTEDHANNNDFSFENQTEPQPASLRQSEFNSAQRSSNPNAYTPEEILSFIKSKFHSGEIKSTVESNTTNTAQEIMYRK